MSNKKLKVAIVVYEQCTASIVLGTLDILAFANIQWPDFKEEGDEDELFDIKILSPNNQSVSSFSGHAITPHFSLDEAGDFDLVFIPGFLGDWKRILANEEHIIGWTKEQHSRGAVVSAVCNGNMLLAETGLLNGKEATTHWSLTHDFKDRYPYVTLRPEKILIDSGDVISGAGVTAYLNMALYLVSRFGSPELASTCSKVFLIDSGRKIQQPYEIFSEPRSHGDNDILQIQEWLEDHYTEPLSVDTIAEQNNLSRRTFTRRFKKATGDSPIEYLQRIRVEKAKRMLEGTQATFAEITWKVGYSDVSSFQKLFKQYAGLSPREYRNKFSMVAA